MKELYENIVRAGKGQGMDLLFGGSQESRDLIDVSIGMFHKNGVDIEHMVSSGIGFDERRAVWSRMKSADVLRRVGKDLSAFFPEGVFPEGLARSFVSVVARGAEKTARNMARDERKRGGREPVVQGADLRSVLHRYDSFCKDLEASYHRFYKEALLDFPLKAAEDADTKRLCSSLATERCFSEMIRGGWPDDLLAFAVNDRLHLSADCLLSRKSCLDRAQYESAAVSRVMAGVRMKERDDRAERLRVKGDRRMMDEYRMYRIMRFDLGTPQKAKVDLSRLSGVDDGVSERRRRTADMYSRLCSVADGIAGHKVSRK